MGCASSTPAKKGLDSAAELAKQTEAILWLAGNSGDLKEGSADFISPEHTFSRNFSDSGSESDGSSSQDEGGGGRNPLCRPGFCAKENTDGKETTSEHRELRPAPQKLHEGGDEQRRTQEFEANQDYVCDCVKKRNRKRSLKNNGRGQTLEKPSPSGREVPAAGRRIPDDVIEARLNDPVYQLHFAAFAMQQGIHEFLCWVEIVEYKSLFKHKNVLVYPEQPNSQTSPLRKLRRLNSKPVDRALQRYERAHRIAQGIFHNYVCSRRRGEESPKHLRLWSAEMEEKIHTALYGADEEGILNKESVSTETVVSEAEVGNPIENSQLKNKDQSQIQHATRCSAEEKCQDQVATGGGNVSSLTGAEGTIPPDAEKGQNPVNEEEEERGRKLHKEQQQQNQKECYPPNHPHPHKQQLQEEKEQAPTDENAGAKPRRKRDYRRGEALRNSRQQDNDTAEAGCAANKAFGAAVQTQPSPAPGRGRRHSIGGAVAGVVRRVSGVMNDLLGDEQGRRLPVTGGFQGNIITAGGRRKSGVAPRIPHYKTTSALPRSTAVLSRGSSQLADFVRAKKPEVFRPTLDKNLFDELQKLCLHQLGIAMHDFSSSSEHQRYKVTTADFEYLSIIGKGGFGRVFLVRKKTTRQLYALKVMTKERLLAMHGKNGGRLSIERDILAACNGENFVLNLDYSFQDEYFLYLATEFAGEGDLLEFKRKHGNRIPETIVQYLVAQIVLGLEALHSRGILYRDLKPKNVLIKNDGRVILADMGLAAPLETDKIEVDAIRQRFSRKRKRMRNSASIPRRMNKALGKRETKTGADTGATAATAVEPEAETAMTQPTAVASTAATPTTATAIAKRETVASATPSSNIHAGENDDRARELKPILSQAHNISDFELGPATRRDGELRTEHRHSNDVEANDEMIKKDKTKTDKQENDLTSAEEANKKKTKNDPRVYTKLTKEAKNLGIGIEKKITEEHLKAVSAALQPQEHSPEQGDPEEELFIPRLIKATSEINFRPNFLKKMDSRILPLQTVLKHTEAAEPTMVLGPSLGKEKGKDRDKEKDKGRFRRGPTRVENVGDSAWTRTNEASGGGRDESSLFDRELQRKKIIYLHQKAFTFTSMKDFSQRNSEFKSYLGKTDLQRLYRLVKEGDRRRRGSEAQRQREREGRGLLRRLSSRAAETQKKQRKSNNDNNNNNNNNSNNNNSTNGSSKSHKEFRKDVRRERETSFDTSGEREIDGNNERESENDFQGGDLGGAQERNTLDQKGEKEEENEEEELEEGRGGGGFRETHREPQIHERGQIEGRNHRGNKNGELTQRETTPAMSPADSPQATEGQKCDQLISSTPVVPYSALAGGNGEAHEDARHLVARPGQTLSPACIPASCPPPGPFKYTNTKTNTTTTTSTSTTTSTTANEVYFPQVLLSRRYSKVGTIGYRAPEMLAMPSNRARLTKKNMEEHNRVLTRHNDEAGRTFAKKNNEEHNRMFGTPPPAPLCPDAQAMPADPPDAKSRERETTPVTTFATPIQEAGLTDLNQAENHPQGSQLDGVARDKKQNNRSNNSNSNNNEVEDLSGLCTPQIVGGYGYSVDFWALGILCYELLCGKKPFMGGRSYRHSRAAEQRAVEGPMAIDDPNISPVARDFIASLLQKDVNARLGSMRGGRGVEDVKSHAFFAGIDWERLQKNQLAPTDILPLKYWGFNRYKSSDRSTSRSHASSRKNRRYNNRSNRIRRGSGGGSPVCAVCEVREEGEREGAPDLPSSALSSTSSLSSSMTSSAAASEDASAPWQRAQQNLCSHCAGREAKLGSGGTENAEKGGDSEQDPQQQQQQIEQQAHDSQVLVGEGGSGRRDEGWRNAGFGEDFDCGRDLGKCPSYPVLGGNASRNKDGSAGGLNLAAEDSPSIESVSFYTESELKPEFSDFSEAMAVFDAIESSASKGVDNNRSFFYDVGVIESDEQKAFEKWNFVSDKALKLERKEARRTLKRYNFNRLRSLQLQDSYLAKAAIELRRNSNTN